MSKPIVVVGGGGHAAVVIDAARSAGFDVQTVLDDDTPSQAKSVMGVAVSGPVATWVDHLDSLAIIAIGSNADRRAVADHVGLPMITVVHDHSWIGSDVVLGNGTAVFAGVVIQPRTVVGEYAIVNTGATVDHDCRIGSFVHIAPGTTICGGVSIDDGVLIGAGATIIPGVKVASGVTVGAGSVVIDSLLLPGTYVGSPARLVHR